MSEDLTQVSHCVYPKEDTGLAIWWVDDCFTNPTKDGGYLPIENIKNQTVNPLTHGNSGDVYEMLLELAQEEGLSFFVCSFEYAEANWELKLNRVNHVVLIDIGYEGKEKEQTYGIDFLQEMSRQTALLASVAFLTVTADRVTNWIISTRTWLPSMPFPIQKSRLAHGEDFAAPPEPEVRALIRYFKQHQPVSASEWKLETWQALRKKAKEICDELGKNDIGHGLWAHHLPHGGQVWTDKSYKEFIDPWTKQLRAQLKNISPAVDTFPAHYWGRLGRDQILGWDMPPIRALAQFDSSGHDLIAVLFMVGEELKSRSRINLNILFHPGIQLKHNYLWFNACALARGLYILASSFSDEVVKIQQDLQVNKNFPNIQCNGYIFWQITESLSKAELGLSVRVHQTFIGWVGSTKQESPCLVTEPFPLPKPTKALKSVRKAYDAFCRAGANLDVQEDGSLLVQVPARVTSDGFWEVDR